jgi:apolipoprotein N-acyltransferase
MVLVNYARLNKISLMIFIIIAITAACMSIVYKMHTEALILWLLNFIVAFIVAVFGSLRIRSEEEEKMLK